jgi:ferredoxin-NADP reductase
VFPVLLLYSGIGIPELSPQTQEDEQQFKRHHFSKMHRNRGNQEIIFVQDSMTALPGHGSVIPAVILGDAFSPEFKFEFLGL